MTSKYNKTIVLVSLFLIVLAVGIFVKTDTGRGYISWLRASASNIIGMNVEAPTDNKLADNIDYSSINIGDNSTPKPTETVQAQKPVVIAKPVSVEATINDISKQIAEISSEVKQMAINNEIQRQLDQIAAKTDQIGHE